MHVFGIEDLLHECAVVWSEVFQAADVDFVDNQEGGFTSEEGLDRVEEFALYISGFSIELRCLEPGDWDVPALRQYIHIARSNP